MRMGTNSITTAEGSLYERKLFVHYQDGHLLWQAGSPVVHRKHHSRPGTPNNHKDTTKHNLKLLSVFTTCN